MGTREPNPDFHLSDAERARLRPGIDLDALQQLLAMLPVRIRPLVLRAFATEPVGGSTSAVDEMDGSNHVTREGRRMLIPPDLVFQDPTLQRLLERVTAPLRNANRREHEQYERVVRPAREAPVLLAFPSEWHHGDAAAVIVRRPSAQPTDLILLRATHSDVVALDVALEMLIAERIRAGVVARAPLTLAVSAPERSRHLPRAWQQHLAGVLHRLQDEPERAIEAVGPCRVIEFRVVH